MSRWWVALGIFVAAMVGGLVGAYTVARHVADTELAEGSFWYSMSIADSQHNARIPLSTLRAAAKGDMDSVIRFNCGMLRLEARRLHLLIQADRDSRMTNADLEKLYEMSVETVKRLESQGKCPGRPWRTLIDEQDPTADASAH